MTVRQRKLFKAGTIMNASVAERLVELAEYARRLGRIAQADRLLLLAWAAFEQAELPQWRCGLKPRQQA